MFNYKLLEKYKNFSCRLIAHLILLPATVHASLIESTIGAAVVNDATATYYNPAALTLLKNSQMIGLGSVANFRTHFTGQLMQPATGFTQFGSSNAHTHYFLPSAYLGIPITNKVTIGLGVIYNSFFRDSEDNALLRYVQAKNSIKNLDFVPAIGIKINEFFALGIGLSYTHVNFLLQPISGFPSLIFPESESHDESNSSSWGGHIGFLLKPNSATLMGFNYRSAITYRMNGRSSLDKPKLTSNHYHFKFWTPARSVFSINHFVIPTLGLIGTVQYIQWSLLKNINIHGVATKIGPQPVILANVKVPYHLHNSWLLTLGAHYRITPKWVIRLASVYNQSPSNGRYQVSTGDSIILAASTGYDINKYLTFDCGYARAFIKNQNIHIRNRNVINGVNKSIRDAFSLKLTFNVL